MSFKTAFLFTLLLGFSFSHTASLKAHEHDDHSHEKDEHDHAHAHHTHGVLTAQLALESAQLLKASLRIDAGSALGFEKMAESEDEKKKLAQLNKNLEESWKKHFVLVGSQCSLKNFGGAVEKSSDSHFEYVGNFDIECEKLKDTSLKTELFGAFQKVDKVDMTIVGRVGIKPYKFESADEQGPITLKAFFP